MEGNNAANLRGLYWFCLLSDVFRVLDIPITKNSSKQISLMIMGEIFTDEKGMICIRL